MSWVGQVMDGGGILPMLVEEEAQKLLWEVYPLFSTWHGSVIFSTHSILLSCAAFVIMDTHDL